MMSQKRATPSEAELDEQYRRNPFPAFSEWNATEPADEARRAAEFAAEIEKEAQERGDEALRRALDVTLRAAAVDTGAIEGLYETDQGITMTIAQRAAGWQALAEAKEILPFFEAQLHALEIVMDLVTANKPLASLGVTEIAVKDLHKKITRSQTHYEVDTPTGRQLHELAHGAYKHHPNHVVSGADGVPFAFAPVLDTEEEMRRLVAELSSDSFSQAPAVVQSAYAHYAFVRIHPFADGNGRVSRALASLYLLRSFSIPLVIFAEDRSAYLGQLRSADEGDHQRFTDFIGWAVVGALELTLDELRHGVDQPIQEQADRLNRLLKPDGEVDLVQADRAAMILLDLAADALQRTLKKDASQFHSTTFAIERNVSGPGNLAGYREPLKTKGNGISLSGIVEGPKTVRKSISILALVQKPHSEGEPIKVALKGTETVQVEARRLFPADSSVRRLVGRWAERQFAGLVSSLEQQTKEELDKLGL